MEPVRLLFFVHPNHRLITDNTLPMVGMIFALSLSLYITNSPQCQTRTGCVHDSSAHVAPLRFPATRGGGSRGSKANQLHVHGHATANGVVPTLGPWWLVLGAWTMSSNRCSRGPRTGSAFTPIVRPLPASSLLHTYRYASTHPSTTCPHSKQDTMAMVLCV